MLGGLLASLFLLGERARAFAFGAGLLFLLGDRAFLFLLGDRPLPLAFAFGAGLLLLLGDRASLFLLGDRPLPLAFAFGAGLLFALGERTRLGPRRFGRSYQMQICLGGLEDLGSLSCKLYMAMASGACDAFSSITAFAKVRLAHAYFA